MDKTNNTPPPWSEAPPWAKYRAQDKTGEWWWYEEEPRIATDDDGYDAVNSQSRAEQYKWPNWKTTLQKRPENE